MSYWGSDLNVSYSCWLEPLVVHARPSHWVTWDRWYRPFDGTVMPVPPMLQASGNVLNPKQACVPCGGTGDKEK